MKIPKLSFFLICFVAFSFNAVANESIQFYVTFTNDDQLRFSIRATKGEPFTVDWDDDSDIETFTGLGTDYTQDPWLEVKHNYSNVGNYSVNIIGTTVDCIFAEFFIAGHPYHRLTSLDVSKATSLRALTCIDNKLDTLDLSNNMALTYLGCARNINLSTLILPNSIARLQCMDNQLKSLDLSNKIALIYVECDNNVLSSLELNNNVALKAINCENNQLSNLYVSNNNKWSVLKCQNNKLPLSNLYEISQTIKPDFESTIVFGEQRLPPQKIEAGEQVDYSMEKEFGGVATVFTVEKDGLPAFETDFNLMEGIVTLNTKGDYQIIMTNSTISCEGYFVPAKVIAEIEVGNVGIPKPKQGDMKVLVYPNPTTGELRMENGEWRITNVEIYDIYGKNVSNLKSQISNPIINISNLSAGIYFIKIQTEKETIVKKIIKQ